MEEIISNTSYHSVDSIIVSYCNLTNFANCTAAATIAQPMLSLVSNKSSTSISPFESVSSQEGGGGSDYSPSFNFTDPHHHHPQQNFNSFGRISTETYISGTVICSVAALLALSNFLIIWIVLTTPFLRSKAVNMLIVNLCFIDLVAAFFDLPLIWTILYHRWNGWPMHPLICKW